MAVYTFPIPAGFVSGDGAGDLHKWLTNKGVNVSGVWVTEGVNGNPPTVSVEANVPPDFTGYSSGRAALEARLNADIAAGKPVIKAAMQKPIASRTNQELALSAIGAYLWKEELT